jgi:mono/diheme cytochrome c family protein
MPILTIKLMMAAVLLGAAFAAPFTMLTILGRPQPNPERPGFRRLHRWAGYAFLAVLLVNSSLGIILLSQNGDRLPIRFVLHWHLALTLDLLFVVKFAIVKVFRQYLRWAPALGLALAMIATVLVLATAGFALLGAGDARPVPATGGTVPQQGDAALGSKLFAARCAGCHASDRDEVIVGPSLKGLFKNPTLPASGRPATEDNVRLQLARPWKAMPAFPSLQETDKAALLAYMHTL